MTHTEFRAALQTLGHPEGEHSADVAVRLWAQVKRTLAEMEKDTGK